MTGETSIADLAAAWLTSERAAIAKSNEAMSERQAREAAAAFEDAVRGATAEDLLIAWETARKVQAAQEMGSQDWLEARSVSELLRAEYSAAHAPT